MSIRELRKKADKLASRAVKREHPIVIIHYTDPLTGETVVPIEVVVPNVCTRKFDTMAAAREWVDHVEREGRDSL